MNTYHSESIKMPFEKKIKKDDDEKDVDDKKIIDKKDSSKKNQKDGSKYIDLEPTLDDRLNQSVRESVSKSVVATFGRYNPPHTGHEKLVTMMKRVAVKESANMAIYASHSVDAKKNPLLYEDKIRFLKTAFGEAVKYSTVRNIIEMSKELSKTYDNLILVVGEDRKEEFETLLNKYNGNEYQFESISVLSSGARDPDSDSVEGVSSTKLRENVAKGDFESFQSNLPRKLRNEAKEIYSAMRRGMKMDEEYLEERTKPLDYAERRKRSMIFRRNKAKILRGRELAQHRKASPDKLKARAKKKALQILRDKISPHKSYSEMTAAEKIAIDTRILRIPAVVVKRIADRQLPKVRQAEAERFSGMHRTQNEDVNLSFEAFLAEQEYSEVMKKTVETPKKKRFHFGITKEGKVNIDKRFKMYKRKPTMFESQETLLSEIAELMEDTEIAETTRVDAAKRIISNEKMSDSIKHKRMIDSARKQDKIRNESAIDQIMSIEMKHDAIKGILHDYREKIGNRNPTELRDLAQVALHDRPAGISPEDLAKLFARVKNSSRFEYQAASFDINDSYDEIITDYLDEQELSPSKREEGTTSLVKSLKRDTPGEKKSVNEAFGDMFK